MPVFKMMHVHDSIQYIPCDLTDQDIPKHTKAYKADMLAT